jgi:hypothetical protein
MTYVWEQIDNKVKAKRIMTKALELIKEIDECGNDLMNFVNQTDYEDYEEEVSENYYEEVVDKAKAIYYKVSQSRWTLNNDDDSEDSYGLHPYRHRSPNREASGLGVDFTPDENEDLYTCHPTRSWFRIAGLALRRCEEGFVLFPEDSSSSVDEKSSTDHTMNTGDKTGPKGRPLNPSDLAKKQLQLATEWRNTLLACLLFVDVSDQNGKELGLSGKRTADATLAIFAVLNVCDIDSSTEWAQLPSLVSAVRKGPEALSTFLFTD